MKIEHLTNKSVVNFHDELVVILAKSVELSIGTAFINDKAISLIEQSLMRNKTLKVCRLLTGLYNCFNKKKDLERLLLLINRYPDKLQVNISLDKCFHWKYYHSKTISKQLFYVGSANFTTGGMSDNRELVIKLSDSIKDTNRSLDNLIVSFGREWQFSRPLAELPLKHYREIKQLNAPAGDTHPDITAFFRQKILHTLEDNDNGRTYAIGLYEDLKPSTHQAIANQKSEWLKNKWDWFILPTRREFEICRKHQFFFVFSKEGKGKVSCYYSEKKGETENIITDDGKYFIAYKPIRYKKLQRKHLEALREMPFNIDFIGWKDRFDGRALSRNRASGIIELLGF